jgi:hypothetical protein
MKIFYVGIIGYGKMGKIYAKEIKKKKFFKIIDILDYNIIKKKPYLIKKFFQSKKINLLIISSPIKTHFKYLKHAYKSTKHIIVEKPIVENHSQLKRLHELNKNFKKKIMIHHNDVLNLEKSKILKKKNMHKLKKIEMFYGCKIIKGSYKNPLLDWLPHPLSVIINFFDISSKFNVLKYSIKKDKYFIKQKIKLLFQANNIPVFVNFSNDLKKPIKKIIFYYENKKYIYDGYKTENRRTVKLLLEKFYRYKTINDFNINFNVYKLLFQINKKCC